MVDMAGQSTVNSAPLRAKHHCEVPRHPHTSFCLTHTPHPQITPATPDHRPVPFTAHNMRSGRIGGSVWCSWHKPSPVTGTRYSGTQGPACQQASKQSSSSSSSSSWLWLGSCLAALTTLTTARASHQHDTRSAAADSTALDAPTAAPSAQAHEQGQGHQHPVMQPGQQPTGLGVYWAAGGPMQHVVARMRTLCAPYPAFAVSADAAACRQPCTCF
jgi:hypothetical protein